MKIDQIKPQGKQYSITIDHEVLLLEPELVYQYHLHQDMVLDQKLLSQIRKENQLLYYFRLSIAKLKKPQTSDELKNYLIREGAPSDVVAEVLDKVKARHYIDDDLYALQYVDQKKRQNGPEKIKVDLQQKGIHSDIISKVIEQIPEHQILCELIPAKIRSIRNKSKKAMMSSVRMHFISKGYTQDIVEGVILHALASYQGDEQKLLEQAYEKTLKKYSPKLSGDELNHLLIQKLYQKGFKMTDIKNIIAAHLDA